MSAAAAIQPFAQLDDDTEAALRASIKRFGVVVPIVVDQNGRIIDGHHRSRIARELNLPCPQNSRKVRDDDDANALAYTLNSDRRQMTTEQRRNVVAELHAQGFSLRSIAEVVKVSHVTVRDDIERSGVNPLTPDIEPAAAVDPNTGEVLPVETTVTETTTTVTKVKGRDGKNYPAKKAKSPLAHNKRDSRNPDAVEERRAAIARLAGEGMTSAQIAQALDLHIETVQGHARAMGLTIHADQIMGRTRKPDPNVVMENTVRMALDLTEGLDAYIEFDQLDGDHLDGWVSSLSDAIRSLTTLRNNLKKELTRGRD